MLNDICRGSFSISSPSQPQISAPHPPPRACPRLGDDPILAQYMTGAAALADDEEYASSSIESCDARSLSDLSSDGQFYSVDDDDHDDQSSDGTRVGSDQDSPIPFYKVKAAANALSSPNKTSTPQPSPHHVTTTSPSSSSNIRPKDPPGSPLTLRDRVRYTHPVWYLPTIERKDACQQLFDKEQGSFLVRQASEPGRMVLSLRTGNKPSIEHFLIENAGPGLKLKGCFRAFDDISTLITHYCQSQDGLPVQLKLPHVIMNASTQQELATLAYLGQDFWTSKISRPPPILHTSYHTTVNTDTQQGAVPTHSLSPKVEPHTKRSVQAKAFSLSTSCQSTTITQTCAIVNQSKLTAVRNQPAKTNGALIENGSEFHNGARNIHKNFSSSSLTNHCKERSAFHTPPVSFTDRKNGIPNSADVDDKLSDYEDAHGPFFQPISNRSDTSSLHGDKNSVISGLYENVTYNAMHNPGYTSDCFSERSDYIDTSFLVDLDDEKTRKRKRLISTDHVEETKTVCLDQVIPKTVSQPVVFTFNVVPSTPSDKMLTTSAVWSLPTSPAKIAISSASSQFSTPSYIEPVDTLIGRVAGATHTHPVVKVNNTLKQCHYTNSIEIKTNGNGQNRYTHSLEIKPPPGPYKGEGHHDSKCSTMPKLRQDHRLRARSPQHSALLQRRRENATSLISHLEVVKKPPPRVFMRSQSLRLLPSNGEQVQLSRALSVPREVKPEIRKPGSLQTVMEPSSNSAHVSPVHKMNNFHLDGSRTMPERSQSEKQAINNHLNEILVDLDELNLLIDDPAPAPVPLSATLRRFPHTRSQSSLNSTQTSFSDTCTMEEVMNNISPELTLRPIKPLTAKNLQRRSDYDNLNSIWCPSSRRTVASSIGTHYSQPWDSNILRDLITFGSVAQNGKFPTPTDKGNRDSYVSRQSAMTEYSVYESESGRAPSDISFDLASEGVNKATNQEAAVLVQLTDEDEGVEDDDNVGVAPMQRDMEPVIAPSKGNCVGTKSRIVKPGIAVRDYVSDLAQNHDTTFGKSVDEFITCTKEGAESDPQRVIRNIRQFMTGIKNYLVQNGERELNVIIESERRQLEQNEFLNIDALIEGALHKCVVKPLERHILSLFVEDYKRKGSLQILKENIEYARTKSPYELGIKPGLLPPEGRSLEKIKHSLHKMQKAYSPINKLQHLLEATSAIYNLIQEMEDNETASSTTSTVSLGADDFLPMFIFVLVQCGMVTAEIEVDYMWGLLHPCILAGEGGYHLTTLSSAVHVLKNLKVTMESTSDCARLPSLGDLQGFMKIIIPDEKNQSIITKILPVRPSMTTKDVVNMIAHRFKFTNPQDYGLYILISGLGAEDRLQDTDCPQFVKEKILKDGRECVFAYKRNNAKFVWPIIFNS